MKEETAVVVPPTCVADCKWKATNKIPFMGGHLLLCDYHRDRFSDDESEVLESVRKRSREIQGD